MKTLTNSGPAPVRLPKLLAPIAVLLLVVIPVSAENGVIEYLEGEVEVIGPAGTVDAEFGMAVTDGDVIATGPSGVVVLRLNDRSQVKLRENTQLRIDSVSEQTVVTLNTGGVFARVARAAAGEGINILAGLRTTKPRFYPWTLELNWNLDPSAGEIVDTTDLDAAYADLLDQDYD